MENEKLAELEGGGRECEKEEKVGEGIKGWCRESTDKAEKGEIHQKPEGRGCCPGGSWRGGSWAGRAWGLERQANMEGPEDPGPCQHPAAPASQRGLLWPPPGCL